jgi:hypothetical protein
MDNKFRVYLWDTIAPTLIVPWPTGVVYCQQAGGCACLAMEQEGFVIPFQDKDALEYPVFNPAVWYEKSISEPFPPPKDKVPDIKDISVYPDKRPYDEVATLRRAWDASIWFDDVCEQIEGLEEPCRQVKRIKVVRDIPQVEAWLKVKANMCLFDICKDKPKYKWAPAILTWANCD